MHQLITWLAAVFSLALIGSAAVAAPILKIESDQLVGATGVNVNGTLYDVQFKDGSCISLFAGCNSNGDFFFTTDAGAIAASLALMDFVFINLYDDDPSKTFGIEIQAFGRILTPYEQSLGNYVKAVGIINGGTGLPDFYALGEWPKDVDTSNDQSTVYAVWSLTNVPEPATLALLGAGLLGFGVSRRKQFRKPASIQ